MEFWERLPAKNLTTYWLLSAWPARTERGSWPPPKTLFFEWRRIARPRLGYTRLILFDEAAGACSLQDDRPQLLGKACRSSIQASFRGKDFALTLNLMVDRSLIRAYRNTTYKIDAPGGSVLLCMGEANRALDALLFRYGQKTCAFITAWNLGSQRLPLAENERRHQQLARDVVTRGYVILPGHGVGDDGRWEPETSLLVIGISRSQAAELGRQFGQAGIVFAEMN